MVGHGNRTMLTIEHASSRPTHALLEDRCQGSKLALIDTAAELVTGGGQARLGIINIKTTKDRQCLGVKVLIGGTFRSI